MGAVLERWSRLELPLARRGAAPIGLHFTQEALNLVQFERAAELRLRAWRSAHCDLLAARKDRASFGALCRQALRKGGFQGRRVVSAMPASQVKITPLTYQRGAQQSDDELVLKLMTGRLEGDLADYVIDYLSLSRGAAHERLALVASCRREEVIDYLNLLGAAGLEVDALEIGPTALRRLVVAISRHEHAQSVLILNFGLEKSYLTIVSNSRLLLDQQVNFGERSLIDEIASQLDLTADLARQFVLTHGFESEQLSRAFGDGFVDVVGSHNPVVDIVRPQLERLVSEIQRAYRYTASETRGGPVEKVYFFGGLARWPGTAQILSDIVGLPAETMPDPTAMFAHSASKRSSDQPCPELAVATGLALRGLVEND